MVLIKFSKTAQMSKKNPLVLIGAGASVDAGLPAAFDMTHQMIRLFQENYKKSYLEGYEIGVKVVNFVIGAIIFKKGIRGEDPFQGINIEELFTTIDLLRRKHDLEIAPFVSQWSSYIDEFESLQPSSMDFVKLRELFKELGNAPLPLSGSSLLKRRNPLRAAEDIVKELQNIINKKTDRLSTNLFEMTNSLMIRTLVEMVWLTDKSKVDYLIPLVSQGENDTITIASLNYDNAIELAAEEANIFLDTGIDSWSENGLFEKPEQGVELLKLHGSVDWVLSENRTGGLLPHNRVMQVPKERFGKWVAMPAVVFGSGNKLTARGPFLELFRTFQKRLEDHEELLVIGYSFRDEHINEVIFGWLNRSKENKIVIIDKQGLVKEDNIFCKNFERFIRGRCRFLNKGSRNGIKTYFENV